MVYIGIDLGGTNIAAGIVTAEGKIIVQGEVPTLLERGAKAVCDDIGKLCVDLVARANLRLSDVAAIGAGVPGIANNDTGVVIFCTNLGWHDVPMRDYLRPYIDKPLYIENDATVAGLAEAAVGATKGAKASVFLTLGTGVGGGLIVDGRVYSGPHHVGSELGHTIIQAYGDRCTCGNEGCWERYASASALIRWGLEAAAMHPESMLYTGIGGAPRKMSAKVVIDAAKAGDPQGSAIFARYVDYVAMGLVSIINFYDPEIIALGGGVSHAGEFLIEAIRQAVAPKVFYKAVPYASIVLSTMGNDAGIIGSAMLGRDMAG